MIPDDPIRMKVCRRVEPQVDSLLPPSCSTGEQIGLQNVGLATDVAQKLEVDLVVIVARRRQLQICETFSIRLRSSPKNTNEA